MLSGFKNLFKSNPKKTNNTSTNNEGKNVDDSNSQNFSEQDTAEKTAGLLEKEEEKMRFRLEMDIYKSEDTTRTQYEINLYDVSKMFENFFAERLKNWRYVIVT